MKRIYHIVLLGMLAAFMTGCESNDNPGNERSVSVEVGLRDGLSTKAAGDGTTVNRCVMEVYCNGALEAVAGSRKVAQVTAMRAVFEDVSLMVGQDYDLVFWADYSPSLDADNHYDTSAGLDEIAFRGDYQGNDETRDAFCGVLHIDSFDGSPVSLDLTRPFGQLNVKTADYDFLPGNNRPDKVSIEFAEVYTGYNVLTATVARPSERFAYSAGADIVGAEGEDMLLSMDYLFAPAEKEAFLADFAMTLYNADGEEMLTNDAFKSVPVQRNWRTNVSGNLLTETTDITVTIVPEFDGVVEPEI